ncbi:MAG TPA: hypothetical protein V6C91_16750 [Coleofasciculaceae cyanobacterium]
MKNFSPESLDLHQAIAVVLPALLLAVRLPDGAVQFPEYVLLVSAIVALAGHTNTTIHASFPDRFLVLYLSLG